MEKIKKAIRKALLRYDNASPLIKQTISGLVTMVCIGIIIVNIYHLFYPNKVQISGYSMYPTLHDMQTVELDKTKKLNYGDIIVFRTGNSIFSRIYVKRIIGMPGDTVQIIDGNIFINEVNENKLINGVDAFPTIKDAGIASSPFTLKENEYFVLGDNRNNSKDSRFFGGVKQSQIIGKVKIEK